MFVDTFSTILLTRVIIYANAPLLFFENKYIDEAAATPKAVKSHNLCRAILLSLNESVQIEYKKQCTGSALTMHKSFFINYDF